MPYILTEKIKDDIKAFYSFLVLREGRAFPQDSSFDLATLGREAGLPWE